MIRTLVHTADTLGEVPLWHPTEQVLYWIDAFRPAIHRFDPATGRVESVAPEAKLGSYALRRGGGLLLATRRGIELSDGLGTPARVVVDPEAGGSENILNDGRCDPSGRFWVGSMSRTLAAPTGRLYRVDGDLRVSVQDDGIFIPNSLAFSPDGTRMYFADSKRKTIFVYDLDSEGTAANRRVFAECEGEGVPDGSSVDVEGYLWNAVYDGGRLVRYAPDGRVDRVLPLPVTKPTSCALGGPGLATLYVTTARFRMSEEALAREPDAGAVLALDLEIGGLPEPLFAG
jgi:sugar lactone lactonase YvrE